MNLSQRISWKRDIFEDNPFLLDFNDFKSLYQPDKNHRMMLFVAYMEDCTMHNPLRLLPERSRVEHAVTLAWGKGNDIATIQDPLGRHIKQPRKYGLPRNKNTAFTNIQIARRLYSTLQQNPHIDTVRTYKTLGRNLSSMLNLPILKDLFEDSDEAIMEEIGNTPKNTLDNLLKLADFTRKLVSGDMLKTVPTKIEEAMNAMIAYEAPIPDNGGNSAVDDDVQPKEAIKDIY